MSGAVVVDASLAVAWVVEERFTQQARSLLIEWERHGIDRIVPCWFACEVASALYPRVRRGELTIAEAGRALAGVFEAVMPQTDLPAVSLRALALAELLNQSHPYDAHYAAM